LLLATEHGEPMPQGTEDVYTQISVLHREQGNLDAAAEAYRQVLKRDGEHADAKHNLGLTLFLLAEAEQARQEEEKQKKHYTCKVQTPKTEKDSDFLLVLMDAHMPRVDGFEATRQIRANPDYDHILVVALSGDTAADDIKKMTEAGMSEHLEKPLRMEALYDIMYAYTGTDSKTKEDDDEYITIYMTKELDGDQGLDVCGGDEEFYHEILNEFVATYENSTQELGDLLRSGDLKAADRLLLDLVGLTANIGAKNLNDISQIIKASLNDTTEKSYLTLVDQYKTSLDNLIKDIKEYK
ncbi:MAG: response regulator, partial [Campylobacterota bacterium]